MEIFKRGFRLGILFLMSLFLVYCSDGIEDDDYDDDNDDIELEGTYDFKFTKGSDVITFTGRISKDDIKDNIITSGYIYSAKIQKDFPEGTAHLHSVLATERSTFLISTLIGLNKSDSPYPIGHYDQSRKLESQIYVSDIGNNRLFRSTSGTVTLKNLKKYKTNLSELSKTDIATFTLDIDGVFEKESESKELIGGYVGKGKIVISESKK